ncbi:response regulator transcription factor [Arcanobacterium bovis]|uniref:Response regulator transcription factor n=1 Tax=Arcanobacterium bovis TaxID=2529275 RepID=A0A4Q9V0N5_9ACTO|nr:response regulator transcription factor [Arcanobacterium bovis]TBW22194.1 response regulator transcription factor [Arcanobacterium bovis]
MHNPVALVVDDEAQMVSIIKFALETQGFECLTAKNTTEAWSVIQHHRIDLAVLDVMLPNGSGVELTKKIRHSHLKFPIILLTALGDEDDRIAGLEAGADDYVTKPFSPRELALRALAAVRRYSDHNISAAINLGNLTIHIAEAKAYWNNTQIDLTETQVRLLAVLARNHNDVVSHREILAQVWNTNETSGGREMIKTSIYRLRRDLTAQGIGDIEILSVRSRGYSMKIASQNDS